MRLVRYRGRFAVEYTDEEGKRKRHSFRTDDRDLAETQFADFKFKWKAGVDSQGDRTLAMIWKAYIADRAGDGKDTARMGDAWKALQGTFGSLYPEHITKELCQSYASQRAAMGRAPGTVWTELGYLRTALNWGAKAGKIAKAPLVWLPPKPRTRSRYLTRKEARRLIDAAEAPHVRLFIILALTTAGRAGAILDLTWDRVDFERRQIQLDNPDRDRTSKGRATVPINNVAMEALTEAHKLAVGDYVIEWGGEKVGSIKKGVAAAAGRARLKAVSPHVLRKTAARFMAEAGVDMTTIAQYLGHTNAKITFNAYARFSPDHLRTAADALEV